MIVLFFPSKHKSFPCYRYEFSLRVHGDDNPPTPTEDKHLKHKHPKTCPHNLFTFNTAQTCILPDLELKQKITGIPYNLNSCVCVSGSSWTCRNFAKSKPRSTEDFSFLVNKTLPSTKTCISILNQHQIILILNPSRCKNMVLLVPGRT